MAQQELRILVKADGTAQVTRQLDGVNRSIQNVETSATKLSTRGEFFKGMIGGALTAAAAYMSVRTALRLAGDALDNFNDAAMTIRQVQATLNSTGRAAEFTTEQLGKMASGLQQVSNYGDEDILKNATIGLLRFDSISKEMFPRVQQLVIDMADSMGGLENATKTLGISIADPILGMTRLRRAGVMLNQDQQDLIKSLVETGKTAEAQGVLLTALESKYGGLAMAGVTASQQLKNAWGDYLETIGGSLSVMDGVKKGMATFFTGIAQDSDSLSKTQMKHILDVQERWAIATLEISQRGKQIITIMGGTVATVFGLLQDTLNGVYYAFNNVYGAVINVFNGLGKIAPRFMEAITGVSTFRDALNDLKNDFSSAKGFVSIEAFGAETQENIKNWTALFGNANESIETGTKSLNEFYDAQRKLVESGKNPFTGADMAEGEDAGALLKQIDKNQSQATERLRDMQGDMLSAWSAYYTTLDQYSTGSIQAQADLYKYQLQQQYGTILSMQQIDEMYNAKLWELRDAQLAHFADNHEEMVERLGNTTGDMLSAWAAYYTTLDRYSNESIQAQADLYKYQLQQQYGTILSMQQIDEMYNAKLRELGDAQIAHFAENYEEMVDISGSAYTQMQEYASGVAKTMGDQVFNAMENSIYSLMADTISLKDVWKSSWAAMRDIALRAMADIIAQTLRALAVQYLLKSILGIHAFGFNAPTPGTGVWTQPVPLPTNSIGGGIGSLPTGGNGNSELLMAINGLRSDLNPQQTPTFNLLIDGKQVYHSVERVKSRLNYMGSGA